MNGYQQSARRYSVPTPEHHRSKPANGDSSRWGLDGDSTQIMAVAVGILFAAAAMGVAVGFAYLKGISVANLTRDPAAVLEGPAYIGFISNAGAALWMMAGAGALFTGYTGTSLGRAQRSFLYSAGALSLVLGLDDLFMLHEDILPRLGVPQNAILLIYAGAAIAFTLRHYRHILAGSHLLFAFACFFLGASLTIDLLVPYSEAEAAIEDGAKLFGITFWFLFVANAAATATRPKQR